MNGIQSLISTIHSGHDRLAKVASTVAVPTATDKKPVQSDRVDLSRQAVEMLEAERQVAVASSAIGRIHEAEGSLLDVLA